LDGRATHKPPTRKAASAVAALEARLKELDRALLDDLGILAEKVQAAAARQRKELGEQIEGLRRDRRDIHRRRNELAEATKGFDWAVEHKDKRDFIGPLTIEHSEEAAIIRLARTRLAVLRFPSGAEVFGAVQTERSRLDRVFEQEWPRLQGALLELQRGVDDFIPWPTLLSKLFSDAAKKRKAQAGLVYTLGRLRDGVATEGWSIATRPPALAQQRQAVAVPRVQRPGEMVKVFAVRLLKPGEG